MSLRRRDLFWQNSEKGGGPGDGDVIVYATNTNSPGYVQENLVWSGSTRLALTSLDWVSADTKFVAGNTLISPDGTYIVYPSIERTGKSTTETVAVPGRQGVWEGSGSTDWVTTTDPSGRTVLASKEGLGNSNRSNFTFTAKQDLTMYVCTDGENNYDYLTAYRDNNTIYDGNGKSQQGASSFTYTPLTVESGSKIQLIYSKDGSQSGFSDRAYMYLEYPSDSADEFLVPSNITLDSSTWEVSGTLSTGETVYKSSIEGKNSTTASAYIRFQADQTGTFHLMCRSNGENNYDYLTVYSLDSTSSVLKSFKGAASTAFTDIAISVTSTGTHYVYLTYSKDGSQSTGEDAAFVYIRETLKEGGTLDMSSTVETEVTVNNYRYARSFVRYELPTQTRTFISYDYSTPDSKSLIDSSEYCVSQYLIPKVLNSDTTVFNEGHKSGSQQNTVEAIVTLEGSVAKAVTGSTYLSERLLNISYVKGTVKYSDNGDLFCPIPISCSYRTVSKAAEYYQSASKGQYLHRRTSDTGYSTEKLSDLLPFESGSTNNMVVDIAFNQTGKVVYALNINLVETSVCTFSSSLYRSKDSAVSFKHLGWGPSRSDEYITAVCTNLSGKVVYALVGTYSSSMWVSASIYRSENYGETFSKQNTLVCWGPTYLSGSTSTGGMQRGTAVCNSMDPRYRMQITCNGKGDSVAVWLVSGSNRSGSPTYNDGYIFRSDDKGLTWPSSIKVSRMRDYPPRILMMNRN